MTTKISQLSPKNGVLGGSEQIEINDAGTSKKVTAQQIANLATPSGGLPPLFGVGVDMSKVRFANGIAKPNFANTNVGTPITWDLISGGGHLPTFFTSVDVYADIYLQINYPAVKNIFTFQITPDETFAPKGVTIGPSVDLTLARMPVLVNQLHRQELVTFNGTAFTTPSFCQSATLTATTKNRFQINGGYSVTGNELGYGGTINAVYAGTNNRVLRYSSGGLGYGETVIELIDPTTGQAATPDVNDKLYLYNPFRNTPVTLNQFTASGLEKELFGAGLSNFWISAIFELN
jgi:hypothetical protein